MNRRLEKRLMLGVAVIALVAGVTAAVVMGAQPAHHQRATALAGRARAKGQRRRSRGAESRSRSVRAAAGYLGVTATQLRAELRSGRSLAQIAEATSGRSAAGVIGALVAAKRRAIDAALEARTITQAHADKLLSKLVARITKRVHRG